MRLLLVLFVGLAVLSCDDDAEGLKPTVGPEGALIYGPEGIVVQIPAGALSAPIEIDIVLVEEGIAGVKPVGAPFEFLPLGTQFAVPVTVTMRYEPITLAAAGASPEAVRLMWAGATTGPWQELASEVAADANTVTARVTSFAIGLPGLSLDTDTDSDTDTATD